VTVLAWRFCLSGHLPVAVSAWGHKHEATFVASLLFSCGAPADLVGAHYLVNSAPQADCVQLPRSIFDLLLTDLLLAAQLAKVESEQ